MLTELFLRMLNREASAPGRGPERILEVLRLSKGDMVADLGSGGGYFSLAMAREVGDSGKVYAVDSNPRFLDFVRRNALEEGVANIETVLGGSSGVKLPEATLDLVFARNVFHHLQEPEEYFRRLRAALKPDGTVAVIDHAPSRGFSFVSLFRHVTSPERILRTMEAAGYRLDQSFDFLNAQTFMVFVRSDESS